MDQEPLISIRSATIDDATAISALIVASSEKYITPDFTPEGVETFLNALSPQAMTDYLQTGFRYHVAEYGGRIIGVAGFRQNAHLYHLFVADTHHHKGIAKKLWQVGCSACLAEGNPGVFTVNASRYAVGFYEKLGFITQGAPEERDGTFAIPMRLITTGSSHTPANR
ncbi:MAG TPA: GNAT family N-acetyltransferase [Gammaproteobacteria bacterium]|nr:GNAT family N-acetyltransferase [Gammaproteobacteria bacterium]